MVGEPRRICQGRVHLFDPFTNIFFSCANTVLTLIVAGNGGQCHGTFCSLIGWDNVRIAGIRQGVLVAGPDPGLGKASMEQWLRRQVHVGSWPFPVQMKIPAGNSPDAGWPLILSLHGAGERGDDGNRPGEVALGAAVREHADWFPAIILFPQAPEGSWWKGAAAQAAMTALAEAKRDFAVDHHRVYAVGLSMGGYGILDLALRFPDTFTALVSVCGGLVAPPVFPGMSADLAEEDPYSAFARCLAHKPVWLFHGEDDPIIPVSESRNLQAAYERLGQPIRYTEFSGGGHNAWDPAFNDPTLWKWLFEQRN